MDIHVKICGYGYGYGWEISYPRQAWIFQPLKDVVPDPRPGFASCTPLWQLHAHP